MRHGSGERDIMGKIFGSIICYVWAERKSDIYFYSMPNLFTPTNLLDSMIFEFFLLSFVL